MAQRIDHPSAVLAEEHAAQTPAWPDPASAAMAEPLIGAFYASLGREDISGHAAEALNGAVLSLLDFATLRTTGHPKIRILRPSHECDGWTAHHPVLQIVNDDMPFLVDSVTQALRRLGLEIHLLAHPVVPVVRDSNGILTAIPTEGTGTGRESMMHVEIGPLHERDEAAVVARLDAVLADVRAAVEDWPAMKQALDGARDELTAPGVPPGDGNRDEVCAFLAWCRDDHFTCLGYRFFHFSGADRTMAVAVDIASGLGVLRDPGARLFDEGRDLAAMPADVRAYLGRPHLLLVTKADGIATVHRAVAMDVVAIKRFDELGRVVGMHVFAGLFTATAYTLSPATIPLVRRKITRVLEWAGFAPNSHDGRVLQSVLDNYPRDELLQADEDTLFDTALAILHLTARPRVALFLRRDEFGRFVSAQVYVPRDRYDTRLRQLFEEELARTYDGDTLSWSGQVAEGPLARLSFVIRIGSGRIPEVDAAQLETRLAGMARSWADRLRDTLVGTYGEDRGLALFGRWGKAFPASYTEGTDTDAALADIAVIEGMDGDVALRLYRGDDPPADRARFKLYRAGEPVPLSDVLPLFEHMGFRVISEEPHAVRPEGRSSLMIHDFALAEARGAAVDVAAIGRRFEQAFLACWRGEAEDDGFNRLVVTAALTWRQVAVLRAYSKYLRQTGSTFTQTYVENSVAANGAVAALLLRLFETRFDPVMPSEAPEIQASIDKALESVANADEDRILRRFLDLILCTLRTNYYQTDADGPPKGHLALKLDSRRVPGLPAPRPMVEVFVYAPSVEGIHLRGGKVARGGIRWSDRPEDFRTEILGLMKAQMVKNAVIVPVGSKGGFVVKRPTPGATREEQLAEGIACYKTFIGGLLDVTDNIIGGKIVPPPDVARHDGDDPYLVVAADKGTATFSDIANGVSAAYGFWLGDAFASGGSRGYDHKTMAITARGAWESVKRHFREMGHDVATTPFTVVGVGDMSGDVFGNGMLRSRAIRLVAAFDHRHIFLDPEPDPERAFGERARLFALPRSSWADYDPALLSPGGAVHPRSAKVIRLSPQVQERFGIDRDILTPTDLIRRLLTAKVDLLWFGGIGTYVKASGESPADVGDRANDPVRVDGREVRAAVVGEGANLAVTQAGRIEYALAGGHCNTDAIDNSAGVDCSDHEVNIKILLDAAVADGTLAPGARNHLLASMTDEVAALVLRDNYRQTQAISLFEAQAATMLDQQDRFMRLLERAGRLERAVEGLPNDEELARRAHAGRGLTRPEIAVLLAYGKLWLYDAILESGLPDDPVLANELARYFPAALAGPDWRARRDGHRLRREIIATAATNSMANRIGASIVGRIAEATGATPADIARAYLVVRDGFGLRAVWDDIEALDLMIPAATQTAMLAEANRLIVRGIGWVLTHAGRPLDIGRLCAEMKPGIDALREALGAILPAELAARVDQRADDYRAQGVPEPLASRVAGLIVLASAHDIATIATATNRAIGETGRLYFQLGIRFGVGWLRAAAERLAGATHWQRMAIDAIIDDLYARQAALATSAAMYPGTADEAVAAWIAERQAAVDRFDQLLGELKSAGTLDLATLTVASHQFIGLCGP